MYDMVFYTMNRFSIEWKAVFLGFLLYTLQETYILCFLMFWHVFGLNKKNYIKKSKQKINKQLFVSVELYIKKISIDVDASRHYILLLIFFLIDFY